MKNKTTKLAGIINPPNLIASSLALALSVSVGSAQTAGSTSCGTTNSASRDSSSSNNPIIQCNSTTFEDTKLTWTADSGDSNLLTPSFNNNNTTTTTINTLTINFHAGTSRWDSSNKSELILGTPAGDKKDSSKTVLFKTQGKGIKVGTLKADLWQYLPNGSSSSENDNSTNNVIEFNFSNVGDGYALEGNLAIAGNSNKSQESEKIKLNTFKGTFGGKGIKGNLNFNNIGKSADLIFNGNANIDGKITIVTGTQTFEFNATSTSGGTSAQSESSTTSDLSTPHITGVIEMQTDNMTSKTTFKSDVYLGGGIMLNAHNGNSNNGQHEFIFDKKAKIEGKIKESATSSSDISGGSYAIVAGRNDNNNSNLAKMNLIFKSDAEIKDVLARHGIITFTFDTTYSSSSSGSTSSTATLANSSQAQNITMGKIKAENNSKNILLFKNDNSSNSLKVTSLEATSNGVNSIGKTDLSSTSSSSSRQESGLQGAKISLEAGNVLASGGSNHIFLKGGSFKGNLEAKQGSNNIILENTLWDPLNTESHNTASTDSSSTGKITTSGGTTNLVIRVSSTGDSSASHTANTAGENPKMYSIHTSSGTSNLVLQGQFNLGAYIDYGKDGTTNLIFANSNDGQADVFNTTNAATDVANNKVLGKTYKDGVKLSLKDKSIKTDNQSSDSSFIEKYKHYFEGVSKEGLLTLKSDHRGDTNIISVQGLAVGNISELGATNTSAQATTGTQTIRHYDVTLEENSAFVGDISLQSNSQVTLTMKKGSKLLTDSANLKLANLKLDGASYHQEQILNSTFEQKNTVIDIASMGSDFASIQREGNKFRLLSIGTDTTVTTGSQPATRDTQTPSGGLTGGSALFRVYVDPTATNGTLGETATQGESSRTDSKHTYSDRILVFEGDKNTHYLQAIIKTGSDISKIAYHGGGTETKDNIAVATVKGTNDSMVAKFEGAAQIQGFDVVGTTLKSVSGTDKDGKLGSGTTSTTGTGEYTTYFIDKMVSRGASMANQLTSAAALGVNYELFIANINSLNKRMGELRDNAYTQGAWGRIFNGMQTSNFSLKTRSIYTTIQAGYDYGFALEGAKNVLGLALSYANSFSHSKAKDADLDGEFKGIDQATSHAVEIALYNAYVQDGASKESRWANGFYSDSILKFSYITSNLSITGERNSYNTANLAASIGEEIGYRFLLGEKQNFYIDPQIEVTFGYLNQSNLKRTLGAAWAQSVQEHVITVRNRVGASYGYKFDEFTQEDLKASLYLGTYYTYDYITGGSVKVTTDLGKVTHIDPLISTSRFTLNLGGNLAIKDNTRVYFDFERSFGGKITTDYQVNLGVRYGFGEKKQIPLKIKQTQQTTQEQKKAPLKLEKNTENLSKEENKS